MEKSRITKVAVGGGGSQRATPRATTETHRGVEAGHDADIEAALVKAEEKRGGVKNEDALK